METSTRNRGVEIGFVVRFVDGETFRQSSYTERHNFYNDIGRQWATAENLPTDGRA